MSNNSDPFDSAFDGNFSDVSGVHTSTRSLGTSGGALALAVDGEASAVEEGRVLGKEEGLLAGFQEGRVLGQKTGVDCGMEIGFSLGLVQAVRKTILSESTSSSDCDLSSSSSSTFLDRIRKSVDELEKAIDDFPGPDEEDIRRLLFRSTEGKVDTDSKSPIEEENELAGYENNKEDLGSTNTNFEQQQLPNEDVRVKLQRIRARCKVLTAKLGIPRHSLKNAMAGVVKNKAKLTSPEHDDSGEGSREW